MKPILMTSENPEGAKLQELLAQLQVEIVWKINKIIESESPQAKFIVENNRKIIEHLGAATALQLSSEAIIAKLGLDQGPTGKPRI